MIPALFMSFSHSPPSSFLNQRDKKTVETDTEDETNVSLRDCSCSSIEGGLKDLILRIKFQFEKKRTVLKYVGSVVISYIPTEGVSLLRKKPGTWNFVLHS